MGKSGVTAVDPYNCYDKFSIDPLSWHERGMLVGIASFTAPLVGGRIFLGGQGLCLLRPSTQPSPPN
eukprot:619852-Prorocentrum_lima.AAC.1